MNLNISDLAIINSTKITKWLISTKKLILPEKIKIMMLNMKSSWNKLPSKSLNKKKINSKKLKDLNMINN